MFKRFQKFDYLIIFLCLFHFAMNVLWIFKNTAPLPWDQAGHTLIAYDFLSFFKGESIKSFWSISTYYPPFVHILTALGMLIFGMHPAVGQITITVFFLLAVVFLYLYSNELFSNKRTSFIAAIIFSFLPLIYSQSRWFLLDIPLITSLLLSLYFAHKSENFTKLKPSLLFALFTAIALLTKWTALIFIIVPFLFQIKRKTNLKFLITSLSIIIFISLPWYIKNIQNISQITQFSLTGNAADPKMILSRENLLWYLSLLANFQLTWIGTILFLLSTFYLVAKKNKTSFVFLTTMLFAFVIFTIIGNKNVRYTLPLLPLMTMMIAFFLTKTSKQIQILLFLILIPYLVLNFFSLSFGFPINPKITDYQRAVNLPVLGWVDYVNFGKETSSYLAPTFNAQKWPNSTILKNLSSLAKERKINILLVVDKENFNLANLNIIQRTNSIENLNLSTPYTTFSFPGYNEMEKYVAYFHFALIAQKSFGPSDALRHKKSLEELKVYIENNPSFQKINDYSLPDNDTLSLYNLNKQ